MTAHDVSHSFKSIVETTRPSLGRLVKRIRIPSDETLVFELNQDDPFFCDKIWNFEIIPDPTRNPTIDFFNHPIGSGPFRFKSRDAGKTVILEANPDYYDARPSLDRVCFHFTQDPANSWTRLISGATDVAVELSPANFHKMKYLKDRFYFKEYVLTYYTILLYNTHHPLFKNPEVRKALGMAIDRGVIVDTILNGYAKMANGPMGVDSPYHNPEEALLPSYDPGAALAMLQAAGWSWGAKTKRF